MHALEHHLAVGAVHPQYAFVAQHARAEHVDQAAKELVEARRVERTVALEHEGGNVVAVMGVVVVMVAVAAMLAMLVVVAAVGAVLVVVLQIGRAHV